jgi:exopolyphosphatase/guanosine-5'-triphosphate,3'-diphosphate pyrophosphatase
MKVAVVDLGTNSCRLLLAAVEDGRVETHERIATVARLGEGVDKRRALSAAAVRRTTECLAAYGRRIERFAPERRRLIATSVVHDATNGGAFLDGVERRFALPWRVLGGDEEAALSFAGAASSVVAPAAAAAPRAATTAEATSRAAAVSSAATTTEAPSEDASGYPASLSAFPRLAVLDIGGGSTELAQGPFPTAATGAAPSLLARPDFTRSLDLGSVRLTERFLVSDPPTDEEWRATESFTRELLAVQLSPATGPVSLLVGVAGTITTLVAHKLALRVYDPDLVHGHRLSLRDIESAIAVFRRLSSDQRAGLPGIQCGREDVIPAGALIAREACLFLGVDGLVASEADILDGVALELAATP